MTDTVMKKSYKTQWILHALLVSVLLVVCGVLMYHNWDAITAITPVSSTILA